MGRSLLGLGPQQDPAGQGAGRLPGIDRELSVNQYELYPLRRTMGSRILARSRILAKLRSTRSAM